MSEKGQRLFDEIKKRLEPETKKQAVRGIMGAIFGLVVISHAFIRGSIEGFAYISLLSIVMALSIVLSMQSRILGWINLIGMLLGFMPIFL